MKRRYAPKPLSKDESARLQQQMKALYGKQHKPFNNRLDNEHKNPIAK